MAIPARIPIAQMEDYHTECIGRSADGGQFMAFSTFVYSPLCADLTPQQMTDWQSYRQEYVLLHLFDGVGNHLATKSWYAGTAATCDEAQMATQLQQIIAALGPVEYGDIEVKPFHTQVDGFIFGLIANPETDTVMLEPNGLAFTEPWDGEYYT